MTQRYLRLHESDNVAVALTALPRGEEVEGITLRTPIPAGHKIALSALSAGDGIFKYSTLIATATMPIAAGEHVHVHNAGMPEQLRTRSSAKPTISTVPVGGPLYFDGIRRSDGRAATRNYVGILTTVNCSATVAQAIAERFRGPAIKPWPGIDGVVALTHAYGCAMNSDSEGLKILRRTLAGYARHPNFAGMLILGLGCESNELATVIEACGGLSDRLRALDVQSTGGTTETIEVGTHIVQELLNMAKMPVREALALSHLSLALQCGGSDAFSGITANPALGVAADLLVMHGGTVILSETPEIYGAEHLLLARATSEKVANSLNERVAWWREHARANGSTLNDNPSAGNIAGGITTILEKSLGAVAKGGTSPLAAVYRYAEPITTNGFVFMDSPGYDPMSATGQVAAGSNIMAFTTGRGSTFGCKPVPSLKLATNTTVFHRMSGDMDINCGEIIDGKSTIQEKGREIFEALVSMASGSPSASERLGFGEAEFVPWVPGAVM